MNAPYTSPMPAPRLAVLLMLAATVLIAATTLAAKALGTDALGQPLHPVQITHGRFLFAFLAIGSFFALQRPGIGAVNLRLHLARTTAGFCGVTLMFASVAYIPLSDATAISFLNPVFAMMLAIPLLGERVGPVRWAAAGIALLGALILLRPGPGSFQPAALLALGAAAILGLEIIFIKRLSGRERPLQILLINNTLGLILSSCAVIAFWEPPTGAQWLVLIGLGLAMAGAQACFVNSVARADASLVVPFSYATLVFATLYDAALFGVIPDAVSWIGAAIILTGAGLLAWREMRVTSA